MPPQVTVTAVDPSSPPARAIAGALWEEIQQRYGFQAPDPFDPDAFAGPVGRFWVAIDAEEPVGSVALMPLVDGVGELDVMYVAPSHRRMGLAGRLLATLEDHARNVHLSAVRLRAGDPQPEAMAFYRAAGFTPIPPFGRWVGDDTARCLEKQLD